MSGWNVGLGARIGDAITEALAEAGRETGEPWARPARPLPLQAIDWATAIPVATIAGDDDTQWPPTVVAPRVERLSLLHDLWRGDLSMVMDVRQLLASQVGIINVFRRVSKFVADLLVREAPTATGPEAITALDLVPLAHTLVTDMTRYGAGLLLVARGPNGPIIRFLDAQYAVPTAEGGWIVAEPRMSPNSTSTLPDVLQFTVVADGEVGVMQRSQTPTGVQASGNLGPVLEAGTIGTEAEVIVLQALPLQPGGTWGTSWYEDILTIAIQTSRRMAANTKILDQHASPLLHVQGDIQRFTTAPGVARSLAVGGASEAAESSEFMMRLRQSGALVSPDGLESLEYVTWDGNLESALAMLDRIDRFFRLISGIPAVLDADSAVPSGMSLRRMFWQFDAAVSPMHHSVSMALSRAVERFGGTLQWENTFEVTEGEPEMTQREDVEDEGEARRGEGAQ